MDITLLISLATLIIVLIIVCTVFLRRSSAKQKVDDDNQEPGARVRPVRRAAGVRNARRRMQTNVNHHSDEEADGSVNEDNNETDDKIEFPGRKIGAKKQAKLAAKAEKKINREAAEREREDRKKKEQLLQEERDKQSEKERAEELRQEETERKAREEKERREHEEYLKMKEAFNVEEEGYEEEDEEEKENLLQEFVDYIKRNKVVILEDLASYFGLKTIAVIDRIKELQTTEALTGVIDDRGKFIYIAQEELEAVAKFIRQRGRVSISDLAENSNHLINLSPEVNIVEAR